MKVGLIGLGTMGKGMAHNLHAAGVDIHLCNRSPQKLQPFEALGIPCTTDPRSLADCDCVITMVSDDTALTEVLVDSGLLDAMQPGAIHCSCSTISLPLAQQLDVRHRKQGSVFVACPVSGRGDLAAAGKLFLIVAGPAAAVQTCQPIFTAIGQRTVVFGDDPAKAVVVKLAINQMIASSLLVMAESMHLVEQHGISAEAFHDFFASGLFACPVYEAYGELMAKQHYTPANFPVSLGLKDLDLVRQVAQEAGVRLQVAATTRMMMTRAKEQGAEDQDWAAVVEVYRREISAD